MTGRGIEAFAGGVFGASFWLILGIIEKLYIFKRRTEYKLDILTGANLFADYLEADEDEV